MVALVFINLFCSQSAKLLSAMHRAHEQKWNSMPHFRASVPRGVKEGCRKTSQMQGMGQYGAMDS